MHGSGHAIFIECAPAADAVKMESDSPEKVPDDVKLEKETTKIGNIGEKEAENYFNGDGINDQFDKDDVDDFFGDAVDEQMSYATPATTYKIVKTSAPKKTRKKMPGGYRRKYDRRIRHDYSEYQ